METLRAAAHVNLAAIERNCLAVRGRLSPATQLAAVVKADGYGHGALAAARSALAGGAGWLAVATAAEAAALRDGGIEARLLVMGALSPSELAVALDRDADVVAWDEEFVATTAALGRARVHVKLDSGMGRLGTRDPVAATRIADMVAASPGLELAGALTHFATADERGDRFFGEQLERFTGWATALKARHPQIVLHAANSAATLREPAAHFDLVRCGIAIYGLDPFGEDGAEHGLAPALELHSYVAAVKRCRRGESAGYGRRFIAREDTTLAVLPIGYGDGWRRALSDNGQVLIEGRRYPLVGTISMDNCTVDLGAHAIAQGTPAILIGDSAGQRIGAEEIARRLHTINYEVTCAISARVPRCYHRDGRPL